MARRLLPMAFLVPIFLAALWLLGQKVGYFETEADIPRAWAATCDPVEYVVAGPELESVGESRLTITVGSEPAGVRPVVVSGGFLDRYKSCTRRRIVEGVSRVATICNVIDVPTDEGSRQSRIRVRPVSARVGAGRSGPYISVGCFGWGNRGSDHGQNTGYRTDSKK